MCRGLAREPQDRWPSLAALLDHLEAKLRARPRDRRLLGLAGLGAAALVAAAVAIAAGPEDKCRDAVDVAAQLWSPEAEQELRTAFTTAQGDTAADTATRVAARLDAYADDFATLHVDSCHAHARGELSAGAFDRRMECLHRRRHELKSLQEILVAPDRDVIASAVAAAHGLQALVRLRGRRCAVGRRRDRAVADSGRRQRPRRPARPRAAAGDASASTPTASRSPTR